MSIENFLIIINKLRIIEHMKLFFLFILIFIPYIKSSSEEKYTESNIFNCNSFDNCFECSNAHTKDKNCKWIKNKCQNSNIKFSDTWFDNFQECEKDINIMKSIENNCMNNISKNSQIITNKYSESDIGIGIANIYCLFDFNVLETSKEIIIKLSKSQESLYSGDNYALVINFKNGEKEVLFLENKNYLLKEKNIKNIEFRYYSNNAKTEIPFILIIQYVKTPNIVLLKKIIILILFLIIFLCIIFGIIFYKWRMSIIKNSENFNSKKKKKNKKNNKINFNNKENDKNKISNKNKEETILTLNNNSERDLKKNENKSIMSNKNEDNIGFYINENNEQKNKSKSNLFSETNVQCINNERRVYTMINNYTH